MDLGFLNKVVVKGEVKVSQRTLKDKLPAEGSDLRVYYTGAVYPSEQFAKLFDLEYKPKVMNEAGVLEFKESSGMGLDIFSTQHYAGISSDVTLIMIAAVNRTNGKIDLFRGCEYDEEGYPKTTVLAQGATSFGKETFIALLKDVYDIELEKDTKPYIDLKVVGNGEKYDMPWVNENGSAVYHVPKTVSRGKNKGEMTYVRREHLMLWALVPTEWTLGATIELSGPVFSEEAVKAVGNGDEGDEGDESSINTADNEGLVSDAPWNPQMMETGALQETE